jgi:phage terminase large subunit-like protein
VNKPGLPVCGHTFDGRRCAKRGAHYCRPRAAHVVAFFAELLVHTQGDFARQPFVLSAWQRRRVIEPLFGEVIWDRKRRRYVRKYRELYMLLPRKQGKSELLAGICLYLLVGEGEQGAEVYGLAMDKDQAGHVYRRAARMVELCPTLAKRLEVLRATGRIVDPETASFIAVAAGDAAGGLGANPAAVYIDELLTQPDRDLYDAMRTGFGTRAQPLLMMATTAESDPSGFAAAVRTESERILADPSRNPERLVVIYQLPATEDWTKEANWHKANPALGDFLDIAVLRAEFRRAQHDPAEERAFRQFRLNQPTRAVGRAIDLPTWDRSAGLVVEERLAGQRCHGGLDLATTTDLAALAWDFPDPDDPEHHQVVWRLFCPEAAVGGFDRSTAGQASIWARQGLLEVTEGNVIDYQAIRRRIGIDAERFDVIDIAYDRWGATQLVQELYDDGLEMVAMGQGFASMSAPTKELLRLVAAGRYTHGGNPAVRWQAEHAVTRADPAGNLKFDKAKSSEKIDGVVAAVMALDRAMRHTGDQRRHYSAASF